MEKRARQSSVSRDALPNMREDGASAGELLSVKPGVSGMNENLMVDPVAAIRRMRKELLAYVLSEGSKVSKSASERVLGIVAACEEITMDVVRENEKMRAILAEKSKWEERVMSGELGVNVRRVDMCATDKVVGSGGAVHMAPVKPRSYAVVLSDANGVMAKEELKRRL
ncbi:hypothetical protein HHI36_024054 [Cryptolaemus montrouzieri]|uniref:Uncharacterized protein n=1 Tax=Cryptolaemus montrouzieri TaxID=559131 RepID=A0ABD2NIF2_9CUCU